MRNRANTKQDAGLDSLHDAIVRQKRIAEVIGGEVGVQNEILEDIGDAMDQGGGGGGERFVYMATLGKSGLKQWFRLLKVW